VTITPRHTNSIRDINKRGDTRYKGMNMKHIEKKTCTCLVFVGLLLACGLPARAEFVGTVALTPVSSHFEAHGDDDPSLIARTYVNDPDTWDFDLSAFPGSVSIDLKVDDNYTPYPDDYDLYWDGTFLGNTVSAYDGQEFNFVTTPATHTLKVEYVNQNYPTYPLPHEGGSYYDMWVDAEVTPAPGAVLLGLLGLGTAGVRLRKFA
jgi:hypothetical protein